MRYLIASCALFLLSGNAFAMGGLWCDTEDAAAPVKIKVESGVSRGMGGPLFNFQGHVEITDKAVAEDLRKLDFKQEHVPQYWFNGVSLNLLLYRERENEKPHGYVEVSIQTQARDGEEGSYGGSYEVMVWDTAVEGDPKQVKLTGSISCYAD